MGGTKILAAGFAFAAVLTSAAMAADTTATPRAALDLGRQMAATAQRAETGVPANATSQPVTAALQTLIISTGAEPRLVAMALQTTLTACQGSGSRAWACPKSAGAYDALRSLQSIVIAQLDQAGVAALGTFGPSAFGSVPVIAPGGAAASTVATVPVTSSGGSAYVAP